jgi:2-hydroxy-6-oxonona-2,4-dienedioate hydrolase
MSAHDSQVDEQWTTIAGLSVFSRVSTTVPCHPSPQVVLIHGLAVSGRTFLPTLMCLAPSFRTYALDLPGFGQSAKPGWALDVAELADATLAWMDAIGLERPVLVGHSMGCQVVAEFAYRHRSRLSGAVLASPTGDPDARALRQQLARLVRDGLREPPRLTALVLRGYLRAGIRRSLATLRSMNAHPMVDRLGELTVPTLLVVGSRDPVVSHEWSAEVIEHLPHGRVAVIPRGAHGIQFAAPDELAGAIQAFIKEAGIV